MDVQEALNIVENIKGDVTAGIVIALYYLIVYWQKIKDGLGLSRRKEFNFEKIEKNYQLLKLRIEIEQLKKKSGLDNNLLERLEHEMQSRLEEAKHKAFTPAQKFIAIPLIIVVIILSLTELQGVSEESANTAIDILSGALFVITTTIVGFWGIPILQTIQKSWQRKIGFIIFWSIGFYIISYFLVFIFAATVLNIQGLATFTLCVILLCSIVCSLALGIIEKLPFMRMALKKNGLPSQKKSKEV